MDLIKSSLKIFAARICKSLFSFLAVVIFSRELGASPLGIYYPFLALLGIIALPADFGISSATTKRISEGKDADTYLGTAIVLKAPLLVITSAAIILAGGYVNQFLGSNLVIPLVITLVVSQIGQLSINVLHGELRVGETAIVEVLRPLCWLTVGYYLYLNGYGVYALVYGYLTGSILMTIAGWWKVSTSINWPTVEHARSLVDYGRFSVISSVGGFFYSWMDVGILTLFVVAGHTITRADIGAYENAWRLALVVMLLGKAIATTLFPQVSRWDSENATDQIESAIPTALLPSLLLVIPAFVGTLVLSKELLRVLFGPEFTTAWAALIVLAAGKIPQSAHILFSKALNAIDRPDLAAFASITSAVINLILNVLFIWQFGLVGAAIATTGSFIVNTIIHAYYLEQYLDLSFPLHEGVWSILSSTIMGAFTYSTTFFFKIDNILHLLAVIVTSALIYTILICTYQPIREEVQRIIQPLLTMVVDSE